MLHMVAINNMCLLASRIKWEAVNVLNASGSIIPWSWKPCKCNNEWSFWGKFMYQCTHMLYVNLWSVMAESSICTFTQTTWKYVCIHACTYTHIRMRIRAHYYDCSHRTNVLLYICLLMVKRINGSKQLFSYLKTHIAFLIHFNTLSLRSYYIWLHILMR